MTKIPFLTTRQPLKPGHLSRRQFTSLLGAGPAFLWIGHSTSIVGCGTYPAEEGEAYAPWDFPVASESPVQRIVHGALLAASPHNTQPWYFVVGDRTIDVFADTSRTLGPADPLGRERHLGLGCAVENAINVATALGLSPLLSWLPDTSNPAHVARLELSKSDPAQSWAGEVASRHTNRGAYLDGDPPSQLEPALRLLIDDSAVELTFLAGERKKAFREGTIAATRAFVADAEVQNASHAWWRQTKEEIDEYRDGLTLDASGLGSAIRYLGKTQGRPSAEKAGEYWIESTKGQQTTAFAFCLLSSADRASREQQLRTGRIYQRMHLWATRQGLAMQPLNQLVERQDREQQLGLPAEFGGLLASLTNQSSSRAQMLFRIGVAWDEALKSPRRPLSWVLR